eukprot:9684350-Karenia_brevis.AAC.1
MKMLLLLMMMTMMMVWLVSFTGSPPRLEEKEDGNDEGPKPFVGTTCIEMLSYREDLDSKC